MNTGVKYVIGAVGAVLLLLIIAVLILNRGGDEPKPTSATIKKEQLVSYAKSNSSVSMTTVGRLVGDDQHRAIRVTITPSERRVEILSGYEQSVFSSQTYYNDRQAYENLLSALDRLGFTNSKESPITDQRGVCPAGNRYVYDVSDKGSSVSNLWAVSCDKSGTFAGAGSAIRQLFQRQIPDYNAQTNNVKL